MRRWIGLHSVLGCASQGKSIFAATFPGFSWYVKAYVAMVGLLRHRAISLAVSNVLQRLTLRDSKHKRQYDIKTCMEGSICRIIFIWTIPGGIKLTVCFVVYTHIQHFPCNRFFWLLA